MRVLSIAFCILVCCPAAYGTGKPTVKACYEDENSYPWVLKDRLGLNILMLQMVAQQLDSKIEVTPLPWRRCMQSVQRGEMDAAFKISYSATRAAELGVYPMKEGQLDISRRMLTESYSLYHLKGVALDWDGQVLKVKGSVGAQAGFSVADQLKSWGLKVDNDSRSADINLRKLLLGRFDALALQTEEGDFRVESNPEFKDKIERIGPVLVEKPYFFMFSKQFAAAYPEHVTAVWDTIAKVRESAEYRDISTSFK